MSRKDYELLAGVLAKFVNEGNDQLLIAKIVEELTYQLAQENPRFDTPKFIKAVFGETPADYLQKLSPLFKSNRVN